MKELSTYINEHIIKGHLKRQYQYVDLGLPSGTLWAKYNLGATNENEQGLYVQFGVPKGYTKDSTNNFLSAEKLSNLILKKYSSKRKILTYEDDAAYQLTNGNMQIPSPDDCKELLKYTKQIETSNGLIFRSIENGKELIIPYNDMFANNNNFRNWMHYHKNLYLLTNTLLSNSSVNIFSPLLTNAKDRMTANWLRNAFAVRPIKYKK